MCDIMIYEAFISRGEAALIICRAHLSCEVFTFMVPYITGRPMLTRMTH